LAIETVVVAPLVFQFRPRGLIRLSAAQVVALLDALKTAGDCVLNVEQLDVLAATRAGVTRSSSICVISAVAPPIRHRLSRPIGRRTAIASRSLVGVWVDHSLSNNDWQPHQSLVGKHRKTDLLSANEYFSDEYWLCFQITKPPASP